MPSREPCRQRRQLALGPVSGANSFILDVNRGGGMRLLADQNTPSAGAADWSRAAVLAASPITVSSRRALGPYARAKMTSPVFTPTRTDSPAEVLGVPEARR